MGETGIAIRIYEGEAFDLLVMKNVENRVRQQEFTPQESEVSRCM